MTDNRTINNASATEYEQQTAVKSILMPPRSREEQQKKKARIQTLIGLCHWDAELDSITQEERGEICGEAMKSLWESMIIISDNLWYFKVFHAFLYPKTYEHIYQVLQGLKTANEHLVQCKAFGHVLRRAPTVWSPPFRFHMLTARNPIDLMYVFVKTFEKNALTTAQATVRQRKECSIKPPEEMDEHIEWIEGLGDCEHHIHVYAATTSGIDLFPGIEWDDITWMWRMCVQEIDDLHHYGFYNTHAMKEQSKINYQAKTGAASQSLDSCTKAQAEVLSILYKNPDNEPMGPTAIANAKEAKWGIICGDDGMRKRCERLHDLGLIEWVKNKGGYIRPDMRTAVEQILKRFKHLPQTSAHS